MDIQDSILRAGDEAAASVAKTDNRVTLKEMHEKITSIEYLYPASVSTLTIAVVTLENGFTVTGESACADPKNFNKELGQKFARDAAIRKIWELEGYLLRQRLFTGEKA